MFRWEVTGLIHEEQDERYMMDDFGNAVWVPFSGEPWEFQDTEPHQFK